MPKWTRLDLRSKDKSPGPGELVALRMVPNNNRATFYKAEQYEIGFFKVDDLDKSRNKKLWWHHSRGTSDPTRLKKHYDIWWCRVAPFDSY